MVGIMSQHPLKTWIEISRQKLASNVNAFRKLLGPQTQMLAVVKANAYGHGAKEITPVVLKSGASWLGVDSIDEALELSCQPEVKKETSILILGYTSLARLTEAVRHHFRLIVYNPETIRALGKITKQLGLSARIHLKAETGTARQGVLFEDIMDLVRLIGSYPGLILEGLSTHFANIEDTTDHSYAQMQLLKFRRISAALENIGCRVPIRHTACTAAAILFPETHFNLARIGIGLYGLWPSRETQISATAQRLKLNLQPILTWKTIIAQVKRIPRGQPVSYGLTEQVSRDSKIAILPIGYRDGYDRKLSSVGAVLIRGQSAKILGRVCMNMTVVDVTDIAGARSEDEVVLIGRQGRGVVTAEELARKIGTINYEVVTRINPLIPRQLV